MNTQPKPAPIRPKPQVRVNQFVEAVEPKRRYYQVHIYCGTSTGVVSFRQGQASISFETAEKIATEIASIINGEYKLTKETK